MCHGCFVSFPERLLALLLSYPPSLRGRETVDVAPIHTLLTPWLFPHCLRCHSWVVVLSVEDPLNLQKGYDSQVMESINMGWGQDAAQKLVGFIISFITVHLMSLGNIQVFLTDTCGSTCNRRKGRLAWTRRRGAAGLLNCI